MIKRTVEISREPVHLSSRLEQLVIQPMNASKDAARTLPCEDIGVVLIDHPQVTMTHRALTTLAAHSAAVVVCGPDHLPAGMLLPISGHLETVTRIRLQIDASKPRVKRLWQTIVQAKIRAQADLAEDSSAAVARRLRVLAIEVKSGDTSNAEGHAARRYWAGMRRSLPQPHRRFRRDAEGLDAVNIFLNYGYAIMRAAVARALVSAGLTPALGLYHRHRSNAFCLADDLVEPLRPMVDRRVWAMIQRGEDELNQPAKAELLGRLTQTVVCGGQRGPLMVALHRYTASLCRCLAGEDQHLAIPVAIPHQPHPPQPEESP